MKTKLEIAENIRDINMHNLVLAEIDEIYYGKKADSMPHSTPERLGFMKQVAQEKTKQKTQKMIIAVIDQKIAQYKKEKS